MSFGYSQASLICGINANPTPRLNIIVANPGKRYQTPKQAHTTQKKNVSVFPHHADLFTFIIDPTTNAHPTE